MTCLTNQSLDAVCNDLRPVLPPVSRRPHQRSCSRTKSVQGVFPQGRKVFEALLPTSDSPGAIQSLHSEPSLHRCHRTLPTGGLQWTTRLDTTVLRRGLASSSASPSASTSTATFSQLQWFQHTASASATTSTSTSASAGNERLRWTCMQLEERTAIPAGGTYVSVSTSFLPHYWSESFLSIFP